MKTQRETPNWLAFKMASEGISEHIVLLKNPRILEPSAGSGKLAIAMTEYLAKPEQITCVELNKDLCNELETKGFPTIHGDFLKQEFEHKFDLIVAAPPFINNSDVLHIQKMFTLLNRFGTIKTLTTPFWTVNNEAHQVAFREFLSDTDKSWSMELLPDNTFTEKGKTVPTALLTIYKK